MSRDGRRDVCCGGTRAILVSSESPISLGHEYHDECEIDPASREVVGGWCFVPWDWRGFAMHESGKHAASLSR